MLLLYTAGDRNFLLVHHRQGHVTLVHLGHITLVHQGHITLVHQGHITLVNQGVYNYCIHQGHTILVPEGPITLVHEGYIHNSCTRGAQFLYIREPKWRLTGQVFFSSAPRQKDKM